LAGAPPEAAAADAGADNEPIAAYRREAAAATPGILAHVEVVLIKGNIGYVP
jgi:hypothetical protein